MVKHKKKPADPRFPLSHVKIIGENKRVQVMSLHPPAKGSRG